ncbi:DNA-directed RNA polymerase [Candidatus Pacearchaeota archaeon]|nr:DNA-directed RNA polymerase [Candidatus Pacearchaeota archaeon]
MFYLIDVDDHVRVEPKLFGLSTLEAVERQLKEIYANYYDKEFGKVITVVEVINVGEGVLIPGDGAAYYSTQFRLLVWKPELHELVSGIVSEVATFGAFVNLGVMRGMIHISQTMEDYVTFSKTNILTGKASKRSLKQGDLCHLRIVAVSHKRDEPKIGLTMRQPDLGKLEWIKEDQLKKDRETAKIMKIQTKAAKGGKKK